jgi:hypothetical protein
VAKPRGILSKVFVVHGTKKFLDRVPASTAAVPELSTTALGNWYATVLFWRPQAALFVNELTLFPVVTAFAPAATVIDRFPPAAAMVFEALELNKSFIESEVAEMAEYRLTSTASRSVVGSMYEFVHLGRVFSGPNDTYDPVALSLRLAEVPCGPLYGRHVSPDRELTAFVVQRSG